MCVSKQKETVETASLQMRHNMPEETSLGAIND